MSQQLNSELYAAIRDQKLPDISRILSDNYQTQQEKLVQFFCAAYSGKITFKDDDNLTTLFSKTLGKVDTESGLLNLIGIMEKLELTTSAHLCKELLHALITTGLNNLDLRLQVLQKFMESRTPGTSQYFKWGLDAYLRTELKLQEIPLPLHQFVLSCAYCHVDIKLEDALDLERRCLLVKSPNFHEIWNTLCQSDLHEQMSEQFKMVLFEELDASSRLFKLEHFLGITTRWLLRLACIAVIGTTLFLGGLIIDKADRIDCDLAFAGGIVLIISGSSGIASCFVESIWLRTISSYAAMVGSFFYLFHAKIPVAYKWVSAAANSLPILLSAPKGSFMPIFTRASSRFENVLRWLELKLQISYPIFLILMNTAKFASFTLVIIFTFISYADPK